MDETTAANQLDRRHGKAVYLEDAPPIHDISLDPAQYTGRHEPRNQHLDRIGCRNTTV